MTNPLDFTGKSVLVIGGSSGIGNGIAHGFRKAGAHVTVTGTRPDEGDYLEAEDSDFNGLAYAQLDVRDRAAVDAFAWPERLDVVVLCQGIARYNREEFTREGWDAVMEVNLDSLMDCANAVRPKLAETGGSLIIISSIGGYKGLIGNPAYGASKAGAISMVKSLGVAFGADGIRVTASRRAMSTQKLTQPSLAMKASRNAPSRRPRAGGWERLRIWRVRLYSSPRHWPISWWARRSASMAGSRWLKRAGGFPTRASSCQMRECF